MTIPFGSSAPDLKLQLWLGRSVASTHAIPHAFGHEAFAATGLPWHPDTWLASLCAWLLFHSFGFGALVAANIAFAVAALILVGLRGARRELPSDYNLLSIILAACCMGGSLYVGVDPFSWFCFALFLYLFEAGSFRVCALAPILLLIWVQFDGRALFGAIFAIFALLGFAIAQRLERGATLNRAILPVACIIVIFLTPLGVDVPLRSAAILHLDSVLPWSHRIAPWDLPNHAFLLGVFALVALAGCYGMNRKLGLADALPFSAALVLALADGRNAAFFGICAAPMVFHSIGQYSRIKSNIRATAVSKTEVAVTLGVALLVIGAAHSERNPPPLPGTPRSLVSNLSSDRRPHRVYCETLQWCDALTASGNPKLRVFMDGRDAAFPLALRKQQKHILSLENGWRDTLMRRGIDIVIAKHGSVLASMLTLLGNEWRIQFANDTCIIFERVAGRPG